MFTDHSPQRHHQSDNPNGLLALGEYDHNFDLVIDRKDSIYSKLRVWIPAHCQHGSRTECTSRPDELHTLPDLGITSISLVYNGGTNLDKWGNNFRFYSHMNVESKDLQASSDTRLVYDVYLMQGKQ
jgi:hypothetical protein